MAPDPITVFDYSRRTDEIYFLKKSDDFRLKKEAVINN
jgi:hypothetical protein